MRKGFTLLELLIVIIIIGVLAVIALTQFADLSERARTGEAKEVINGIRTAQAVHREDTGGYAGSFTDLEQYIATPPTDNCANSHWFRYVLSNSSCDGVTGTPCYSVSATRCTSGGKNPDYRGTTNIPRVYFAENASGGQCRTQFIAGRQSNW